MNEQVNPVSGQPPPMRTFGGWFGGGGVVVGPVGVVGPGGGGFGGGGSPGFVDVGFFFDVFDEVVGAVELLAGPDVGATDVLVGSEEYVSGVVSSTALRFSGGGVASSRAAVSDATVANTVETTTSATPSAM